MIEEAHAAVAAAEGEAEAETARTSGGTRRERHGGDGESGCERTGWGAGGRRLIGGGVSGHGSYRGFTGDRRSGGAMEWGT